ncbi:hypothetical protein MKEN_00573400 [Mycena kentingensis (nom. inval.)]|nr:hypothetical protein MKEN_00573400 [Mycena kentingensis (nom. inval.)]
MSSIGDLSVELIQNIVHNFALLDLAALRTTSRYLQLAVDPLFCEVIFIPSGHIEHPTTQRFLTDLADGTSAWSRYGRILAVCPLASLRSQSGAAAGSDASNVDLEGLIRLVERAIRACAPQIRSIQIFRVDPNQSPWLHDIVCSALANLCPEYFALDIAMGCPTTSLPLNLSGLSVLKVSTPAPPSNPMFQPTVPFDAPIDAVMDIVTRSPSLRVLHLTGPNDWDLVWTALAESEPRIRLTEVKVNEDILDANTHTKSDATHSCLNRFAPSIVSCLLCALADPTHGQGSLARACFCTPTIDLTVDSDRVVYIPMPPSPPSAEDEAFIHALPFVAVQKFRDETFHAQFIRDHPSHFKGLEWIDVPELRAYVERRRIEPAVATRDAFTKPDGLRTLPHGILWEYRNTIYHANHITAFAHRFLDTKWIDPAHLLTFLENTQRLQERLSMAGSLPAPPIHFKDIRNIVGMPESPPYDAPGAFGPLPSSYKPMESFTLHNLNSVGNYKPLPAQAEPIPNPMMEQYRAQIPVSLLAIQASNAVTPPHSFELEQQKVWPSGLDKTCARNDDQRSAVTTRAGG